MTKKKDTSSPPDYYRESASSSAAGASLAAPAPPVPVVPGHYSPLGFSPPPSFESNGLSEDENRPLLHDQQHQQLQQHVIPAGGVIVEHHHHHHYLPTAVTQPTTVTGTGTGSNNRHQHHHPRHGTGPRRPLTHRIASVVSHLLCTCTRAVAFCCALACMTLVLAVITAGSMIHFGSGIIGGGDGNNDGLSGIAPEHGDPAYAVDGVRWACGPELPPISALRHTALSEGPMAVLDLGIVGSGLTGAVRYWGLDRAPTVALARPDDLDDLKSSNNSPVSATALSQIVVSVHVSHADLLDLVQFTADVEPDKSTWRIRLTAPNAHQLPPHRRQCIVASVNATVGGAVRAVVGRTDNLDQVLISSSTAMTTTGAALTVAPPLNNLDMSTGNGAVVLAATRPWAVTHGARVHVTNGKATIAGPLVDTQETLDVSVNNGEAVVHAARVAGTMRGSSNNGLVDLTVVAPAPGTEITASADNGEVKVSVSEVPRSVGYAKLTAKAIIGKASVSSSASNGWPERHEKHSGIGGSAAELEVVREDESPADGLIKVLASAKVGDARVKLQ